MSVKNLISDSELDQLCADYPVVVLDFTASWCGPCRSYAPVFEAVASSVPGAAFVKVDVDTHPGLARRFNVMSVPTTVVLDAEGLVRARAAGALPERELRQLID